MNVLDFANFGVAWSGAAIAWVGAFNSNRASGADRPRVVATTLSLGGSVLTVEIVNVGGRGATDIQIRLDGAQVGCRGGLVKGGIWQAPIPVPRDGARLEVVSRHGSGRPKREWYVLRVLAGAYQRSR